MDLIDDELLKSLEVKPKVDAAAVPAPAKAVINKIKQLKEGVKSIEVECMDLDKLRFLAHVMTGSAFLKSYELYGGSVVVQFSTPSNKIADEIFTLVVDEETYLRGATADNRKARLAAYMMVASIFSITINNKTNVAVPCDSWETSINYELFIDAVPFGVLRGVEEAYVKFKNLLDLLTKKALEPGFYSTP